MDKERLTSFIRDEEVRIKMFKIIDLMVLVKKRHEVKFTDFLNPFEIRCAISILNSQGDLGYTEIGGYSDAERRVIAVYPDYYFFDEDEDKPVSVIEITGKFKFSSVSHKDFLGSVLGLGIKREKIGDILVHEDYCQMMVSNDISDFIVYNLERIGRNRVQVKEISQSDVTPVVHQFENKRITVSSPRIDSVISEVYNLSRSEASRIVSSGFVRIDYELVDNGSKAVYENALVSVRRYGRFLVDEFGSNTRKGKLALNIKKYV